MRKALVNIDRGEKLVGQRNKILTNVDKGTVREYMDSPLADNGEDAARLRAAINRVYR